MLIASLQRIAEMMDAEDLDAEAFEHPHRAAGIVLGHSLRCADDDRSGQRKKLGEGQRDVAGAGRQVDQ